MEAAQRGSGARRERVSRVGVNDEPTRGRLIALEGLDGCGKSTQRPLVARALRDAGHEVVETREPTDGRFGRRIRELARAGERAPADEELRWFVEDRREHVEQTLEPALAAGRWVVTDRYFLSTVAYQGARYQGARGLDWERILADSEAAFPAPDLALLFELPVDVGLERATARDGARDAFERADELERVAAIFAAIERRWIARVDASGAVEQVSARALGALHDALQEGPGGLDV